MVSYTCLINRLNSLQFSLLVCFLLRGPLCPILFCFLHWNVRLHLLYTSGSFFNFYLILASLFLFGRIQNLFWTHQHTHLSILINKIWDEQIISSYDDFLHNHYRNWHVNETENVQIILKFALQMHDIHVMMLSNNFALFNQIFKRMKRLKRKSSTYGSWNSLKKVTYWWCY